MPSKIKKSPLSSFFVNMKIKKLLIAIGLIVALIALGLLKDHFVVALVNGEQISRIELIRELEKAEGKRILDSLVIQTLITQEAKKRNVSATDENIQGEIAKIEKNISDQGQKLDDLLAVQNLTRRQLEKQIIIQILLQKMVGENIQVTDIEVDDYIEKNKESLPENANMDELKIDTKEQLKQQKLNGKIQELIQKLQKEAKIDYLLKF